MIRNSLYTDAPMFPSGLLVADPDGFGPDHAAADARHRCRIATHYFIRSVTDTRPLGQSSDVAMSARDGYYAMRDAARELLYDLALAGDPAPVVIVIPWHPGATRHRIRPAFSMEMQPKLPKCRRRPRADADQPATQAPASC